MPRPPSAGWKPKASPVAASRSAGRPSAVPLFAWALAGLLAIPVAAQQIPTPPSPPSFGSGLTAPTVTAPSVSPVTAPTFGSTPGTASQTGASSASTGGNAANSALAMSSILGDSSNDLLANLLGQDSSASTDDQLLNRLVNLLQGGSGTDATGTDTATLAAALSAANASSANSSTASGQGATASQAATPQSVGAGASASAGRAPGVSAVSAKDGSSRPASGADIARFSLGAYDVTPTITLLLTSSVAANGAFLLSGDRSYLSSGATLRETFYFLCRRDADGAYVLHADVAQETANEWSACRRLAKLGALRGEVAGDQILFRASDAAGPIYLLLSLFGATAAPAAVR